jgi:NAD-dependent dihydropyrimidine dehydrogenase PreA subunit
MVREVDYNPKPIDEDFFDKPKEYPVTGSHQGHEVRAEGMQRNDADGKPYPTKLGIHGTNVAVDWETCIADGACMDVCPTNVYEWFLNPGVKGTGNDKVLEKGSELWAKYRTDKTDMVREQDCIFCNACVTACPTHAISVAMRK